MATAVKVLCVDDEENVLRSLTRLFSDEEFAVVTAPDAESGLVLLAGDEAIKVVVSDYRMPGRDGVSFLKEVRERWPDKVRLVLSGYADTASVLAAVNEGHIYKFIAKPWQDDDLLRIIRQALDLYRLQEENRSLSARLRQNNQELQQLNRQLAGQLQAQSSTVLFQSRALETGRFILDALPVGVIGIDDRDESVVQCNEYAARLLGTTAGALLLREMDAALPPPLAALVGRIPRDGSLLVETVELAPGRRLLAKGVYMQSHEGQQGIILALDHA